CLTQRVDEIVCLGDMVGYGPDSVECVDLVREYCAWSLLGDFEAQLFMEPQVSVTKFASPAIAREKALFKPNLSSGLHVRQRWEWLESLSPTRREASTLYVHATPHDPMIEYLTEADFRDLSNLPSKVIEIFSCDFAQCFCGHMHVPGVATLK